MWLAGRAVWDDRIGIGAREEGEKKQARLHQTTRALAFVFWHAFCCSFLFSGPLEIPSPPSRSLSLEFSLFTDLVFGCLHSFFLVPHLLSSTVPHHPGACVLSPSRRLRPPSPVAFSHKTNYINQIKPTSPTPFPFPFCCRQLRWGALGSSPLSPRFVSCVGMIYSRG